MLFGSRSGLGHTQIEFLKIADELRLIDSSAYYFLYSGQLPIAYATSTAHREVKRFQHFTHVSIRPKFENTSG